MIGNKRIHGTFEYDVCLSFAGEDRAYVETVANHLYSKGVKVFYDKYERVELWGKDLYVHLDGVYRNKARFCVMFISQTYAAKLWTNHERKSAQARAFTENREYILPARFDNTDLPGLPETVGYVNLNNITPEILADMILDKLLSARNVNTEVSSQIKTADECQINGPRKQFKNLFSLLLVKTAILYPIKNYDFGVPLGLWVLKSYLRRAGIQVDVFDERLNFVRNTKLNFEEVAQKYDVIGFSACTCELPVVFAKAAIAKKLGKTTILGGIIAGSNEKQIASAGPIDYVIPGVATKPLTDLMLSLSTNNHKNEEILSIGV